MRKDGINYLALAQVAGAGTTSLEHHYQYRHNNVTTGSYYYRIKQTDLDGRFSYSKTVMIRVGSGLSGGLNVYPNPIEGEQANINFYLQQSSIVTINLYTSNGRLIRTSKTRFSRGQQSVPFSLTNLPSGVYVITVKDETGIEFNMKIIK